MQLDKEMSKKSKHKSNHNNSNASRRIKKASHDRNIRFVSSVMLLEAASRNAVDEGETRQSVSIALVWSCCEIKVVQFN